jgi:cbb3-type cytochrome oxidase subunit 3
MNGEEEKISKSLANYFGVSTIIAGISSFVGLVYWLYKVQGEDFDFNWSIFFGLIAIGIVLCGVGVFLLKKKDKDSQD